VRVRKRNWARLIKKVWLEDPSLCPRCGKPLQVIAAISSPAQDEVIEKILKAHIHNTNHPIVTVQYPFHPLKGKKFRPVGGRRGPPPTYVIQLPTHRLSIPVWMTEDWAATLKLNNRPLISVNKLFVLASLVEIALNELKCPSSLSNPNSNTEEDHDDGQLDSVNLPIRSTSRGNRPTAVGSKKSPRVHGKSSSTNPQRRGGNGGSR